jgi:hypothetical protein
MRMLAETLSLGIGNDRPSFEASMAQVSHLPARRLVTLLRLPLGGGAGECFQDASGPGVVLAVGAVDEIGATAVEAETTRTEVELVAVRSRPSPTHQGPDDVDDTVSNERHGVEDECSTRIGALGPVDRARAPQRTGSVRL